MIPEVLKMIRKEHPYIEPSGRERHDLVRIYSDLGVSLEQVDTGRTFNWEVIDPVTSHHYYREILSELGTFPPNLLAKEEE